MILYAILIVFGLLLFLVIYKFLSDKNKIIARTLIYPIFLELVLTPVRGYVSFQVSTFAGFFLFTSLSYYLNYINNQKIEDSKVLIALITGLFFVNGIRVFNFMDTLISFPDALFHLFGIVIGFLLFKIKTYHKWVIFIVVSAACVFMYFKGYELWINKLNFGSFTGKIENEKIATDIAFVDSADSIIYINQHSGKIIILEFWNSKCGVCYSKFPDVQKVYNKYKNNPKVSFYAVNFFLEGIDKDGDAFRIIKERGYSFPVLVCKDQTILKELKVIVYPTVLIISKNGELVFRGNIEDADKKIDELL